MRDDTDGLPFFDQLLVDTLRPVSVEVGDVALTVAVPDGTQVGDLDDARTSTDVLEVLLAPVGDDGEPHPDDEALLDEVLDELHPRPARETTRLADALLERFALAVPPPCGWVELVDTLDRWGPGIEWDLLTAAGGLRLADFLLDARRHPWSLLLRILGYLPQGGGYWAALQDDDELARAQLEAEDEAKSRGEKVPKPSNRPPLLGWSADAERETSLIEVMRQAVHATWGASPKFKGKGGKPPGALPRPRTAITRVKRERLLEEHDEIVGMLLPRGVEPPPDDDLVGAYRPGAPEQPQRRGGIGERIPPPEAVRGGVLLDPHQPFEL